MEKNTILAIVLSVVVVVGWSIVQGIFFAPDVPPAPPASVTADQPIVQESGPSLGAAPESTVSGNTVLENAGQSLAGTITDTAVSSENLAEEHITMETNLVSVIFSNRGGDIVSYKLKEHMDEDTLVEMVLPGSAEPHAFSLAFGNYEAKPIQSLFQVNRVSPVIIEFFQDFSMSGANGDAGRFRLTKRYEFIPEEYLFQLSVTIDGGSLIPQFAPSNTAYTIGLRSPNWTCF